MTQKHKYVRFFREAGLVDAALVGGKSASLGEMYQSLVSHGIRVPNGFTVTAEAYRYFLEFNQLKPKLREALASPSSQVATGPARARELILRASMPDDLAAEIIAGYSELKDEYGESLSLAVRSSATAEDLPDASFAGQQESYLNVRGDNELVESVKRCFASLFTDRATSYRADRGYDHFDAALAVIVMKMVHSDLASSGVMFSLDTESGFRDVVLINSSYGLGENIVQGVVDPDEFYVYKKPLANDKRAILSHRLGAKQQTLVYGGASGVKNVKTPSDDRKKYSLTDERILELADAAIKIEGHYSKLAGEPRPMDIEWALDGEDSQLYIVQARPETVAARASRNILEEYALASGGDVIVSGRAVGSKVASGRARVIKALSGINDFQPGDVLVAETTTPDWAPVMKLASALVTNRGGRTCHAAIVARELGIPAVVGTTAGTEKISDGQLVTVSCAEGDEGKVYDGEVPYKVTKLDISGQARPKAKIMVNIGNPSIALKTALMPNDGVGLARLEFIISRSVGAHPLALLHPEKCSSSDQQKILALLAGASGRDYFIEKVSEAVAMIAAAFYPRPVTVRLSDFKSNEYAGLLGGRAFEPSEENPMLGFRGASRYVSEQFSGAFEMECAAMRRVRDGMGLTNVILMVPFVRRVAEADAVIRLMAENGLKRGQNGLKIYAMCEIPNNVIQVDEFARHFDGLSIGSNDLTQLTLGVDRDSELVASDFDERDEGVKTLIKLAVEGCQRNHIYSGICGQAPSDYPEITEFLVNLGIDSISLNPDTVLATTKRVLALEKELGR